MTPALIVCRASIPYHPATTNLPMPQARAPNLSAPTLMVMSVMPHSSVTLSRATRCWAPRMAMLSPSQFQLILPDTFACVCAYGACVHGQASGHGFAQPLLILPNTCIHERGHAGIGRHMGDPLCWHADGPCGCSAAALIDASACCVPVRRTHVHL